MANQTPLPALFPNDVVMAGDFPIVVLHATGSNGTFSGDGFVTFPFIEKFKQKIGGAIDANSKANVGIKITFNNIGVNTDFKLISGEIVANYDPNWGSMIDGDKLVEEIGKIITSIGDLFTKAEELEKQKAAGTITNEDYLKDKEAIWNDIQKANDQYKELIKATDLPDDLKERVATLTPPLPNLASNDAVAMGKTNKKYLDKIDEIAKEVEEYNKTKNTAPLVIFVNGYFNKDIPLAGEENLKDYWGEKLIKSAANYISTTDENIYFLNGADEFTSNGDKRFQNGKKFAEDRFKNIKSNFYKNVFYNKRKIIIVSHSMGAAFAEGVISFLKSKNIEIEKVVHLSPADNSDFSITFPEKTFQIDISIDPVLLFKNSNDKKLINGIKNYALVKNPDKDNGYGHYNTKVEPYVWNWFEDLETVSFDFKGTISETTVTTGSGLGYGGNSVETHYKKYSANKMKYNTIFIEIKKSNKLFFYKEEKKMYYSED